MPEPKIKITTGVIARLLPVWALAASLAGYFFSTDITPWKFTLMPVITLIMFSMGLTLTLADIRSSFKSPVPIILGVSLQFLLMPLLAWIISQCFALSSDLLTGMVLVGSAPGGTASNVLTYLAGGNLALSIGMTTLSTLISVIATPWLTDLYLGQSIIVDQAGMLASIAWMVILPLIGGMILRALFPRQTLMIKPFLPDCAAICIAMAVGIVVALNANAFGTLSISIIIAVILHHITGLMSGYGLSRLLGLDITSARTIAIEVGTQNSGMMAALAIKHFTLIAAIPPALFSVVQNVLCSALASYWSKRKMAVS